MTAQLAENLHYEGKEHAMCNNPLHLYFRLACIENNFVSLSSALRRGYVGTWEILDGRLYLIGLDGWLNGMAANVATFFPNYPDRVFAHWYSGELRLPRGKMLEYEHAGYLSVYEEDVLLTLDKGVVTHTEVRNNGISTDPEATEGYCVGAWAAFPRDNQSKDKEA